MASKWYPLGVEMMVEAPYDWEGALMKMALTTSTYDSAHDVIGDVTVVGTAIALTNPAVTVSSTTLKLDADDTGLTWNSVAAGSTITGVIVYYDGATKPMLTFNDVSPDVPTNGGNITVTIHASGIGTIDFS